jgi:hypothetical protein
MAHRPASLPLSPLLRNEHTGRPPSSRPHCYRPDHPSSYSTWPHAEPDPPPFLFSLQSKAAGAPAWDFFLLSSIFPAKALPSLPSSFRNKSPPSLLAPVSSIHRISSKPRHQPPPPVPKPLHPQMAAPSSPPLLPQDVGHIRAARRSLEHRLGPLPRWASSTVFMPCHHHC